jgi:hypothetical protein
VGEGAKRTRGLVDELANKDEWMDSGIDDSDLLIDRLLV